jgi:hypothetical protein
LIRDDRVIQLNAEWLGKMLGVRAAVANEIPSANLPLQSIFEGGCLFDSEWVDIPDQENEVLQVRNNS